MRYLYFKATYNSLCVLSLFKIHIQILKYKFMVFSTLCKATFLCRHCNVQKVYFFIFFPWKHKKNCPQKYIAYFIYRNFQFCINLPKSSPNLKSCFIKRTHCTTYTQWLWLLLNWYLYPTSDHQSNQFHFLDQQESNLGFS